MLQFADAARDGRLLARGTNRHDARIGLEDAINKADWVVTGEGRMDRQTLSGKGPNGVAQLAQAQGKPIVALAGSIPQQDRPHLDRVFPSIRALTDDSALALNIAIAARDWQENRLDHLLKAVLENEEPDPLTRFVIQTKIAPTD